MTTPCKFPDKECPKENYFTSLKGGKRTKMCKLNKWTRVRKKCPYETKIENHASFKGEDSIFQKTIASK